MVGLELSPPQAKEEKQEDVFGQINQRPQQPQMESDPKAEAWGAKNRWFGSDKPMTYTAFDLHNKMVNE